MINYISSLLGEKIGELSSTNKKVIDAHVDPPNWTFFGRLYFGPQGVLAPQTIQSPKCISSRTWGAGWPHVGLCPIFLVHFFNQPQDPRAPSADRRETLPRDHYLLRLDNPGPKIRGPSPKKFGANNMQNLDRFYTTSDFDRE